MSRAVAALRDASGPVGDGPPLGRGERRGPVICVVDPAALAGTAVRLAARLAARHGVDLVLVATVPTAGAFVLAGGGCEELQEARERAARRRLAHARAAASVDVDTRELLVAGDAVAGVRAAIAEEGVATTVVLSDATALRERRRMARLLARFGGEGAAVLTA